MYLFSLSLGLLLLFLIYKTVMYLFGLAYCVSVSCFHMTMSEGFLDCSFSSVLLSDWALDSHRF